MELNESFSTGKLAYICEHYKKLEKNNELLTELKSEHIFTKLPGKNPGDEESAGTNRVLQKLQSKTGDDVTMVDCKSVTIFNGR